MKHIENWEDLNGLENDKGLCLEVYIRGNTKSHCECYIFDGINNLNLGVYPINNLEEIIYTLKKYGFNIEYEEQFNLVEFLKKTFKKTNFVKDEQNYFFTIEADYVYLHLACHTNLTSENDTNVAWAFVCGVNNIMKTNKVTPTQLQDAFKKLEWI